MSQALECTTRGRFPNDETDDCRGYTMCLMGGLTNFTQYKLLCPMGSVYSHLEQQCTNATNYKCYPTYNCTSTGNFAYLEKDDCSSYVACIQGLGNLGTARLIQCPQSMLFNPEVGVCVNSTEYACIREVIVNSSSNVNSSYQLFLFCCYVLFIVFSIN